jgi:hypothetical protein
MEYAFDHCALSIAELRTTAADSLKGTPKKSNCMHDALMSLVFTTIINPLVWRGHDQDYLSK